PTVQAVHAWTVGGIGIFTLGMMARVALGHTGRNIEALPLIPTAFILIMLATLIRVIVPGISPAMMEASVLISAICWVIAFGIAALRYTSILLHARVDGKPG
ncbi:MAG: NnrS family protein, partial [Mariprofundaceae bacterium]|nr:NnrS family protein [Mariprofundaceae bacterium]